MCPPPSAFGYDGSGSGRRQMPGTDGNDKEGPIARLYKGMMVQYDADDEEEGLLGSGGNIDNLLGRRSKYHHVFFSPHNGDKWRNVLSIFLLASACFLVGEIYGERHERAASKTRLHSLKTISSRLPAEPNQKFILISQQRSGSRFLTSLLDGHSNIRCGNEELLPLTRKEGVDKENMWSGIPLQKYMAELDSVMKRLPNEETETSPIGSPISHVGFKIMYDQGILNYGEDLMKGLESENVKIIHLIRKNKLLQFVSKDSNNRDKLAEGHNAHPTTEAEVAKIRDVTVSGKVKKIIKYLREKYGETENATQILDNHYGNDGYLTIYYEDLDKDNQGEMTRIFDFLGVKNEKVESQYAKIHEGKRTREYFAEEDRADVEAAIRNSTRFAQYLEPDPPNYLGW